MGKTYKYCLYPTAAQTAALEAQLSEACRLYNAALQERRAAYQRGGLSLNYYDQANQLKAIRTAGASRSGELLRLARRVRSCFKNSHARRFSNR